MFKTISVAGIGLLLLNGLHAISDHAFATREAYLPFVQFNLLCLLLGMIMEWQRFSRLRKNKTVKAEFKVIPALFLLILLFIPQSTWSAVYGKHSFWLDLLISPLMNQETHTVIGVLSGNLLLKGLDP